jgi:hypothetical protein
VPGTGPFDEIAASAFGLLAMTSEADGGQDQSAPYPDPFLGEERRERKDYFGR